MRRSSSPRQRLGAEIIVAEVGLKLAFLLTVSLTLSACVAPETPPPPRANPTASYTPPASGATFEDAPLPNRKMGGPTNDSIIRLAK